jgi:hypothetical protein
MIQPRQSLTSPGLRSAGAGRFRRQTLAAPEASGPPPAFTVDFINEVDDDGTCSGSVTAVPSGGVAPYTYQWGTVSYTTPVQYDQTLVGACGPSDWEVLVTDDVGNTVLAPWHVYRAEHTGTIATSRTVALASFATPSVSYNAATLGLNRFNTQFEATIGTTLVANLTAVRYRIAVTTRTSRTLTNTSGVTADVGGTEDLPYDFNFPSVTASNFNQRIFGPTSRLAGQGVTYGPAVRTYDSGEVNVPGYSSDFNGYGTLNASTTAYAPTFTPLNAWTSTSTGNREFGFTEIVFYDYHCARQ